MFKKAVLDSGEIAVYTDYGPGIGAGVEVFPGKVFGTSQRDTTLLRGDWMDVVNATMTPGQVKEWK